LPNGMIRRLFNLVCILSLLLFSAALVLSIWSEATSTHSVTLQHGAGDEHEYETFELPPPYVLPVDFAILPLIWLGIWASRPRKVQRGFTVLRTEAEEGAP
jgi:hypothetical protein